MVCSLKQKDDDGFQALHGRTHKENTIPVSYLKIKAGLEQKQEV